MFIQNPLQEHGFAFPILETVHLGGIFLGVGAAALVNLRLLGIGLTQKSSGQLWRESLPWTLGGLTIAITAGLLLLSVDVEKYYASPMFKMKMVALVLAIAFYFTAVRRASAAKAFAPVHATIACISLGLWAAVPFGGVFLGYSV